jgi:hypothetical protein
MLLSVGITVLSNNVGGQDEGRSQQRHAEGSARVRQGRRRRPPAAALAIDQSLSEPDCIIWLSGFRDIGLDWTPAPTIPFPVSGNVFPAIGAPMMPPAPGPATAPVTTCMPPGAADYLGGTGRHVVAHRHSRISASYCRANHRGGGLTVDDGRNVGDGGRREGGAGN